MRHRVKNVKLGRKRNHTKALLRNLVTSLILHERIRTTERKAKAIQPIIDRLISQAKGKDQREAIRTLQKVVYQKEASEKVISDLVKRFEKRSSGFTRITPIGVRGGDAAPLVQIEFVS